VYIAALTANVDAGEAVHNPSVKVSFPTGNSKADKLARVTAAVITLQNLNGPGKGCPVESTTLLVRDHNGFMFEDDFLIAAPST
jgi:hypothetical protein